MRLKEEKMKEKLAINGGIPVFADIDYETLNIDPESVMKELLAVKLWTTIEGVEPNSWFCFLYYDKDKMGIDKETFAKALEAEGIPVGAHYVKPMYEGIWIKEKKIYGNSACPWMCPQGRDIDYTHCCPIAEKALEDHMTLYIHECWTGKEIEDTLKALEKVEKVYSI